jgi:putative endonuclease
MKKYVFIVTDRNRNNLHVGLSADLNKTMDFYQKMPNLFFDAGAQISRLVYFEELTTEQSAQIRFSLINRFTRTQKEKLIRAVNQDWLDLSLALKHEAIVRKRVFMPQAMLSFAS